MAIDEGAEFTSEGAVGLAPCEARDRSAGAAGLRAVFLQTTPTITSEVTVLLTLLRALEAWEVGDRPRVLLLQGVDGRHPEGHQAAETFARLECVTVKTVEIGGLGRAPGSKTAQAMKMLDVGRVWATRRWLQRLVTEFEPHVVYSAQQRWDQRLAVPLAKDAGLPRVVHLHYNVGPWLGASAVRALLGADMVIAVSDFISRDAMEAGVPGGRIHTLRNPARDQPGCADNRSPRALRRELAISDGATVVGMVSRLSKSKCQLELLDAMLPLLRFDRGDIHLVIAGAEDPPASGIRDLLQRRAAEAGVSSKVHLLGHRNDVPTLLDGLDIFAHPSRHEPFGLAILEAMGHGLPVVAWREGGPAEIVSDPDTGILVSSMDIPALTGAIAGLLTDVNRRKEMGNAGRARVRSMFRADDAVHRFVTLLEMAAYSRPEECSLTLTPRRPRIRTA
jgi:glycosyltransferase involved in cell wall biosynthesis